MKRQKFTHNKEDAIKNNIRFCSECGEDLDSFGLDGAEIDIKKIEDRHKRCKEKGKFKGDVCSMMFIADPSEPIFPKSEDD
jgi:hypothetical protein